MTGVFEYDECEERSWLSMVKRIPKYNAVIASIYGQYLHYIGSMIEHAMLKVLTLNGYKDDFFMRGVLEKYIQKTYNIDIKNIPNYKKYEGFYVLWNFLKHNSINTYKKLKEAYPEILIDKDFKNGDYSLHFVKLSDELIMTNLKGLGDFFNSFCETVFKENCEEAAWNYDDYFFNTFKDWKEDMQCGF